MRSVRAKIFYLCLGTVSISLIAFLLISRVIVYHSVGMFAQVDLMLLQEARQVLENGGPGQLAAYLSAVERYLPGQHYLTDANGKDAATGADRSDLLKRVGADLGKRKSLNNRVVVVFASPDRIYRFIRITDPPLTLDSLTPYYILVLAAVGLVCWALAFSIATPLRALTRAVERFGSGDLTVRLNSTRRDELGELSRTFDQMADRIGTLLTAERRLLQDVSHELRSPLARMSFATELIKTTEDRETAAARLQKEIKRLTDLVATLMQVTRTEVDPSCATVETFDLGELLNEIAEDCHMEAEDRSCRLVLTVEPNLTATGDRELLRRGIENIVLNSIHHAPEWSAVDITLEAGKDIARIAVRDYGPGVPDESLERIFQPFFRVDDSRSGSTGGLGLGLAIARRAITLYRGTLYAKNMTPGLRISIELPRSA